MKPTHTHQNSQRSPNQDDGRTQRRRKFELINFTKMHGLGNDFMVIETLTQQLQLTPELIQSWSDRHTGVGFDQLLVIAPPTSSDIDFQYIIYNSDGSEAGQCGNGARAIARFIHDQKLSVSTENSIATCTNTMKIRVLESGLAQVDMDTPVFKHDHIPFKGETSGSQHNGQCSLQSLAILGKEIKFYPISVGNPHAVIFLDNIDSIDPAIPRAIQCHSCFPEGVNVGFAQVIDDHNIRLRVFERGAGETQACGSGATAAAIAAIEGQHVQGTKIEVHLQGGNLSISWDKQQLQMTGPAVRVFTGRLLVKNPDLEQHV